MPISFHLLLNFPFLKNLSQEELLRLSTQMSLRKFARREVVVSKGQPRHEFGFLVEGRLQGVDFTVDGRSVGLYFVEPGDYFSELSVVDGQPASEHIIAAAKSTAVFLESESARRLIFGSPELANGVMLRLAGRVREVSAQRTLLSLPNPFQRLCAQLIQLPHLSGTQTVDPVPTHQELAIMINTSRETVTRAFQVLALHDVLQREGNVLHLKRLDYLKDIAEGRADPPKS